VWFGVTAENQEHYDRRWPIAAQVKAKIRFVSYEPALGPLDIRRLGEPCPDWMIVGGESGPGTRSFDLAWASNLIDQCRDAGVAVFIKQLGRNPVADGRPLRLRDRKGGDLEEWLPKLRIRETPARK